MLGDKVKELHLLFDFEAVVDIRLAALKLMIAKYNNSKYLLEYASLFSEDLMKVKLLNNPVKNPLNIIMKPEYTDSFDDLYKEILQDTDILYLITPTALQSLLVMCNRVESGPSLFTQVVVHSDIQNSACKKLFGEKLDLIRSTDEPYSLKNCDALFLADAEDVVLKYTDIGGRSIYIFRYKYNLEKNLPKSVGEVLRTDIFKPLVNICQFSLIDPYVGLNVIE